VRRGDRRADDRVPGGGPGDDGEQVQADGGGDPLPDDRGERVLEIAPVGAVPPEECADAAEEEDGDRRSHPR
jgi:hypothetical protein